MEVNRQKEDCGAEGVEKNSQIKKLLPKGACVLSDFKKYEYIKQFIRNQHSYLYILPINSSYSPFVVIKTFIENSSTPLYSMYYHLTKTFLLSAQSQKMSIGCNYIISSAKIPQKDECYVGKMRGNFNRNEFSIFDNGDNPDKIKLCARRQLSFIKIEESSLWSNQSCKLSMIVPQPRQSAVKIQQVQNYEPVEFQCSHSNPNPLLKDWRQGLNTVQSLECKQFKRLREKQKDDINKMIVLESSMKSQPIIVKKRSQTYYELEIGCPLTILQGFGFLLSLIQAQVM